MFDHEKIVWMGSGFYYHALVLGGLLELMIDVYEPHPTKGPAFQIRIGGRRVEKLGTKLWLSDLDAAKRAAVDHLNRLVES